MPDTFTPIPDHLLEQASPRERKAYAAALRRHVALSSPLDFSLMTRPKTQDYPHTRLISTAITGVPPWGGLIVIMGPRQGKSYLCSEAAPAWALAQKAEDGKFDTRVLHATYAHDFMGSKLAPKVHGLIKGNVPLTPRMHPRHQGMTDFLVHPDDGDGFYFGTGVGGPMTGMGADWLFLDDLIKNAQEAKSKTIRDSAWDWYVSVAEERLEPGGRTLVIGTPWHEDDVMMRLVNLYKDDPRWRIIRLPSIAEDDDELGREPGEALCPDRFPIEELERKRRKDPVSFAAMHQGRPSPAEGDVFKEKYLLEYDQLPDKGFRFGTLDTAHSLKTKADYTVLTLFFASPAPNAKLYVTHVFRERVESGRHIEWVDQQLATLAANERPAYIGVEDKTFGSTLLSTARRQGRRGKVLFRPMDADTDKMARAQTAATLSTQGQLLFKAGAPWLADTKHELLVFDNGVHDDIVDTISYGALQFVSLPTKRETAPEKTIDRSHEARAEKEIRRRQQAKKRTPTRLRKALMH